MNIDWIERARRLMPNVRDFIDGRSVGASSGETLTKFSPRDGRELYRFGAGQAVDVDRAVSSARRAFDDGRWSKASAPHRKKVLHRFAALVERNSDELALLECLDVGK